MVILEVYNADTIYIRMCLAIHTNMKKIITHAELGLRGLDEWIFIKKDNKFFENVYHRKLFFLKQWWIKDNISVMLWAITFKW